MRVLSLSNTMILTEARIFFLKEGGDIRGLINAWAYTTIYIYIDKVIHFTK